jgi:anti-sigma regulatory factor (Ser/Thr protein kinase)
MDWDTRMTLVNELGELARVNEIANSYLRGRRVPQRTMDATDLVLEEALSNIIRHGFDDAERHEIAVDLRVREGQVEIQVVDDGREFDPASVAPADIDEPLQSRRIGGLGVHLLRAFAAEIRYRHAAGKNHLYVRI